MFAAFAVTSAAAAAYPPQARFVPLVVSIPAALLAGYQLARELARRPPEPADTHSDGAALRRGAAWIAAFILLLLAGGFAFGGPLAVAASQRFWLKESWRTSVASGALTAVLIVVVFEDQLGVVMFEGWIESWIRR